MTRALNRANASIVSSTWWGDLEVDLERGVHIAVGPLDLWVFRLERDWRIVSRRTTDRHIARTDLLAPDFVLPTDTTELRVAVRQTRGPLSITPALADRPIVARPLSPIHLPGGESVDFYLSTPLWLRLGESHSERAFYELPTQRLSDTWFGRTTTAGELCYASKKSAEERRADVQTHPGRAITKTTITNLGEQALQLERVALPLPSMALYLDAEGTFWTPSLVVAGTTEGLHRIDVTATPPAEAEAAQRITPPRLEASSGFSRAFDAVFG